MPKRTYTIAFKREVIEFIREGNTAYQVARHFSARDRFEYEESMFYQWFRNQEKIFSSGLSNRRFTGGGRKPTLGALEEVLADEIVELRLMKFKVTRTFISDRARSLAEEHGLSLEAKGHWISDYMDRNGFSLRRTTNLTSLTDEQLIQKGVDYMKHLRSRLSNVVLHNTILMDETAVYLEDARTQTVEVRGRKHVVMKSTGFSSMRITVVSSVWADGRKATPLIIHKGKDCNAVSRQCGPIFHTTQKKAWVDQELIIHG